MSIIDVKVRNIEYLDKYIRVVSIMAESSSNESWQNFLQDKVLDLARKITDEKLIGGTTNDIYISEYKGSHKISKNKDGFILYNDATVEPVTSTPDDYPNGFSVALAFEYGVGVQAIGSYNDDVFKPWEYNMSRKANKEYGFWALPNDSIPNAQYTNDNVPITFGHDGFEIYRNIAIESNNNMVKWFGEWLREMEK